MNIKAGLFVWGEDKFKSIPDTIFSFVVPDSDGTKVAYYQLNINKKGLNKKNNIFAYVERKIR
jgi:hypothetical protein